MWLFTETGFVSAVQHRDNPDLLVVRARDRISLEPLTEFSQTEITTNPLADYPYRTILHKDVFSSWVAAQINFLEYPNFKDQVAVVRGKSFARTLGRVWATMLDAEDDEAHTLRQSYDSQHGYSNA
jgi:hypothetical protein